MVSGIAYHAAADSNSYIFALLRNDIAIMKAVIDTMTIINRWSIESTTVSAAIGTSSKQTESPTTTILINGRRVAFE